MHLLESASILGLPCSRRNDTKCSDNDNRTEFNYGDVSMNIQTDILDAIDTLYVTTCTDGSDL